MRVVELASGPGRARPCEDRGDIIRQMSGAAPDVVLDVVELWVGSIEQMRRTLEPFGFNPDDTRTHQPLEGDRPMLLRSGETPLLLREGVSESSLVRRHVAGHGDGVGCLRLTCDDPADIAARATSGSIRIGQHADGVLID